jgi:hypothetical protein
MIRIRRHWFAADVVTLCGPGESYSDVILRLAASGEASR